MNDFFVWVRADKIPYQAYLFKNPLKILELKNFKRLSKFFKSLQNQIKEKFYACGFLSYEAGYLFEKKLEPLLRKSSLPFAYFGIYKDFERKDIDPFFDNKELYHLLKVGFKNSKSNITKEEYFQAIEKIKNYIASGDVYQVNFTFKIKFKFQGDLEKLFHILLFSQRCKYGFFIKTKASYILSFSPELFLEKNKNNLKSSPMKGTLKRRNLYEEDLKSKMLLKNHIKNQAENIMIVDLIRNDLGRVCEEGSIYVSQLFKVETYPTLHQMISTVKGNLKTYDLYEIFKALFPCGSVTGTPKIRAIEIIRELEKEPRGIYTGAIGFIEPDSNFLFNVAIRTLTFKKTKESNEFLGEVGIGGGIVWDSIPEEEFRESILKAKFFLSPYPYFKLIESFFIEKTNNRIILRDSLLPFHFKRIKMSALYFKFKIPKWLKSYEEFDNFIKEKAISLKEGKYKGKLILSPSGEVELHFSPFEQWSPFLKVGLVKRDFNLGIFFFHKTSLRDPYEFWQNKAQEMGLDEVIFYDEEGALLEGCISNVFIKINNTLITPPLNLKILNGVLRQFLISKKKVKENMIKIEDLKIAKTFYIGNAVRGLGKVSEWVIL